MKKLNYLWMGILGMCLIATSCKKNETNNSNSNTDGMVFKASIEKSADTRTSIDPQGSDGIVNWTSGDKIQISNGEGTSIFTLTSGAGSNTGEFTTSDNNFVETEDYVAVYPQTATIGADGIGISLASVQNYDLTSHSFAEGINPMVAASTTNNLNFKNVCGGITFTLRGNGVTPTEITSVVLTAKKTSEKLWGEFNVTNFDNPTMEYTGNGGSNEIGNKLTLAFEPYTLGPEEPLDFYFILPQGVLSQGFRIEVLTTDGNLSIAKETNSSAATILRNNIWKLTDLPVPPPAAVPSTFSVDEDHRVFVSRGNLQYVPCEDKWQFPLEQYEYIGNAPGNTTPLEEGRATMCDIIDLFGWGTSGHNHGAVCYQPWAISETGTDYYAYGDPDADLNDNDGTADWGYNVIHWDDNVTPENYGWRTMTNDEWHYMFDVRVTPSGIRYAKGNIDGRNGLFMLPDEWDSNIYTLNNPNEGDVDYSVNTVTMSDWKDVLEAHGVMFLPCGGDRQGLVCETQATNGDYWSATHDERPDHPTWAHQMYFTPTEVTPDAAYGRIKGRAVRLVKDVPQD